MDWGRAKSLLIISFLLLNVLLGYQLWRDISAQLNANIDSAELPQDKVLLMQQKRITLAANLPSDTPSLSDLTYLLHSDSEHKLSPTELEAAVDSALIFNNAELHRTLGDQIPDIEHYAYDLHNSQDGIFVLHRMVDGRPMFNVKLELHTSDLKITAFRQDRIELVGYGEPKQVLSAAKVVASLIETYLDNGSVITDISLGYHGQIFDSEKQVSAPTWRVMLEDGKMYYVHAISGEVAADSSADEAANGLQEPHGDSYEDEAERLSNREAGVGRDS